MITTMAQASPEWPRLLKGAELVARDMNGSSDPYAVLTVGHQTKTSKAAKPQHHGKQGHLDYRGPELALYLAL